MHTRGCTYTLIGILTLLHACTSSFSPFFAAHTSTVLLARRVPHLSRVCVYTQLNTSLRIPLGTSLPFTHSAHLVCHSIRVSSSTCLCSCMETLWSLFSLFPTERVFCHLSMIKPNFFFITTLTSRLWLFEPYGYIQATGCVYKYSLPVHTHSQDHSWHICAEWCCLCSWNKSVLLHTHLHRTSAAFDMCKCSMVTFFHILHNLSHTQVVEPPGT